MGLQADKIAKTFKDKITADMSLPKYIKLFDNYFFSRSSLVVERENSGIEGKWMEHLRDRLCHGMSDQVLAAELRSEGELTLEMVISKMKCKELISQDIRMEKVRDKDTLRHIKTEMRTEAGDTVQLNTANVSPWRAMLRVGTKEINFKADPGADEGKTGKASWDPRSTCPECFQGIECMSVEYKIAVRKDAVPHVVTSPRRIPHPIREQFNQAIIRERIILPSVEENMAIFAVAIVFNKLY
ncbi:hypothetical protein B566_EDAN013766 [Ephemera danica]|nr:hypothetical protein B566_EDAN013766 [Ephemera danica]